MQGKIGPEKGKKYKKMSFRCCGNLGFRFKFISYNILSQTILNDHKYLYQDCNPKDLEWPNRGYKIIKQLISNRADIICLQEVECEHLSSLYKPRLKKFGYDCVYKQKTGQKVDGCAIFYNSKRFHLRSYKGIEFNRQDINELLDKDNVGIIAVFEPKSKHECGESRLVVGNTHLLYNPRRSDIRFEQLRLFIQELDDVSFNYYDKVKNRRFNHPTILCGDLNCSPSSEISKFIFRNSRQQGLQDNIKQNLSNNDSKRSEEIRERLTDAIDIDEGANENNRVGHRNDNQIDENSQEKNLEHPFLFKSAYPFRTRNGIKLCTGITNDVIDYIYYTPDLFVEYYGRLPTVEEFIKCLPIPNSDHPSDHLYLKVNFRLL